MIKDLYYDIREITNIAERNKIKVTIEINMDFNEFTRKYVGIGDNKFETFNGLPITRLKGKFVIG